MSRQDALSPVGRETLHDRVYAELRRSLIHGMFEAGEYPAAQIVSRRILGQFKLEFK